uniref:Hexosyltransferase n=2 Tax=Leptobrachium leishanense TaxID=445787 RepID=A0A8C5Q8A3_9ANUR
MVKMRRQLFVLIFVVFTMSCIFLITSIFSTYGNRIFKPRDFMIQLPQTRPLPITKESVNLTDGVHTYYLNLSRFQEEIPFLQDYQCSLTLTPSGRFQDRPSLLILAIKSHPASGARRTALRQTWATEREVKGFWVKPIFLMAQDANPRRMELVKLESREFGDILQWDFTESHHNLSLKERCFLEWLHHHLPQVEFIFKGDDDEYVNPYAVVQYIKHHGSSPFILHGNLQRHSAVMRQYKYRVSENLYPHPVYPYFLSGGGFLFPGRSVKLLYEESQRIPVFPLDDVYFGFLGLAANLTYRHDSRFHVSGLAFKACRYQRALVVHGINPEQMVKIHNEAQNALCK